MRKAETAGKRARASTQNFSTDSNHPSRPTSSPSATGSDQFAIAMATAHERVVVGERAVGRFVAPGGRTRVGVHLARERWRGAPNDHVVRNNLSRCTDGTESPTRKYLVAAWFCSPSSSPLTVSSRAHWLEWFPTNYVSAKELQSLIDYDALTRLHLTMLAISVPFLWTGAVMTIRRLRDAGLPLVLLAVYFLPVANLLLLIALCLAPSNWGKATEKPLGLVAPPGKLASALLAIVINGLLGAALVYFATTVVQAYGWGVFVGAPLSLGFTAAVIFSWGTRRKLAECLGVAYMSVLLVALMLLAVAIEGFVCIAMAAPIWLIFASIGGFLGHAVSAAMSADRLVHVTAAPLLFSLLLPALEAWLNREPGLREVSTEIIIEAPPAAFGPTVRWPTCRRRRSGSSASEPTDPRAN